MPGVSPMITLWFSGCCLFNEGKLFARHCIKSRKGTEADESEEAEDQFLLTPFSVQMVLPSQCLHRVPSFGP